MKQLLTIALVAILVSGCRKEGAFSGLEQVDRIRSVVTDSMGISAAATYNFNAITAVKVSPDSVYWLVRSKEDSSSFLALWLDRQGGLRRGSRVALELTPASRAGKGPANGMVTISSLGGKQLLQSKVENGFIRALHVSRRDQRFSIAGRAYVVPVLVDPYRTLSEVVVIATRSSTGAYVHSTWMALNAMFAIDVGSSYYAQVDASATYTTGYATSGGITGSTPIRIDDETAVTLPAIDVGKYLDCFDQLPDAGATCSIELLTDIPVDSDPNKLVDWRAGSPGHTFLQLRKAVNGKIVVQNIGFYPVQSWKVSISNAPVPGKFVDNGNHEYNASLTMHVSADNFRRALNELRYLARSSTYDLDEFNCTDIALRVFNSARLNRLDIPLYQIPGGITARGTSTPQGVYNKLKAMRNAGGSEAANISIPGVKGYVAHSNGPCN